MRTLGATRESLCDRRCSYLVPLTDRPNGPVTRLCNYCLKRAEGEPDPARMSGLGSQAHLVSFEHAASIIDRRSMAKASHSFVPPEHTR